MLHEVRPRHSATATTNTCIFYAMIEFNVTFDHCDVMSTCLALQWRNHNPQKIITLDLITSSASFLTRLLSLFLLKIEIKFNSSGRICRVQLKQLFLLPINFPPKYFPAKTSISNFESDLGCLPLKVEECDGGGDWGEHWDLCTHWKAVFGHLQLDELFQSLEMFGARGYHFEDGEDVPVTLSVCRRDVDRWIDCRHGCRRVCVNVCIV